MRASASMAVAIGAIPLWLVLTTVGWIAAGLGMHGPPVVDHLWRVLIPGAIVVPYVTGHHAGDHMGGFALFLGLQYAYACLLLAIALRLRSASSRTP